MSDNAPPAAEIEGAVQASAVRTVGIQTLGLALSLVLTVAPGASAAGQRPEHKPGRYCHDAPRFSLVAPPSWNLSGARRQVTPAGEFDVARWEVQGSRASVSLRLHRASADETLAEWASQLGGDLAWTALGGGVGALWRTSLFEAVYERSILFRVADDPRVIEILLVVPGIRGWMGPARQTEPQYSAPRLAFDAMVRSIVVGACPETRGAAARYFTSPEEAVGLITELLRKEDWATLSRYYDLSGSSVDRAELESGRFFVRTERPEGGHPAGFWRHRHPFPPGFKFDRVRATEDQDVIIVVVSIEIDQGGGRTQRGLSEFRMRKSPKGSQILPP